MHSTAANSLGRMSARPTTLLVGAAVFTVGLAPLLAALAFSFTPLDGDISEFGLDGYTALLAGGRIAELSQVVARAAAATALALLLGVPAAFYLRQLKSTAAQIVLLSLMLAPWLVSDMLRAFGWHLALSPIGFISKLWSAASGAGPLEGLRYNHSAALVGLVSAALPTSVLSTYAALPRSDSSEWLSARELASPAHVFRLLALGRARLGVAFGTCMTFLLCLFAAAEPQFLDGPTRTSIQTIASSLSNVGVSALMAFGMVMLVIVTGIILAFVAAWLAYHKPAQTNAKLARAAGPRPFFNEFTARPNRRMVLDVAAKFIPVASTIIALLLCLCPLAALSLEAFREPTLDGGRWTFDNFSLLMTSTNLLQALGRSALLALIVAIVATASGFALSLTAWVPSRARIVLAMIVILALLPGEVYALGLLQVAKALGREQGGLLLVGIAHLVWIVPFTTGSLMLANASVGRNVIEAALELGRSPSSVATQVVARMNWASLAAASVLSFTLSLNENARSSYLGGFEPALANAVFGRLQAGLLPENREIFAVEMLLVVSALVSALVVVSVLFRVSRRPMP